MGPERRKQAQTRQRWQDLGTLYFLSQWRSQLSQQLLKRGQQWIMRQCALPQQKPIQMQDQRGSLLRRLQPFLREPFLRTSMTLTPTLVSLQADYLAAQTQWTLCRRGAQTGWSPTSTRPPTPTSRCSPPS